MDYDILPAGSPEFLHRLMDTADCGRAATSHPISDANWPMVTLAGTHAIDRMIDYIEHVQLDPLTTHTSDMTILIGGREALEVQTLRPWAQQRWRLTDEQFSTMVQSSSIDFLHFAHHTVYSFQGYGSDTAQLMVRWLQLRYFRAHHILHIDAAPVDLPRSEVSGPFFPLYFPSPSDTSARWSSWSGAITRHRINPSAKRLWSRLDFWKQAWRADAGEQQQLAHLPSYAREEGETAGWKKCADPGLRDLCPFGNMVSDSTDLDDLWLWHSRQMRAIRPDEVASILPVAHVQSLRPPSSSSSSSSSSSLLFPVPDPPDSPGTPRSELVYMISAVDPMVTMAYAYRRDAAAPGGRADRTADQWWQAAQASTAASESDLLATSFLQAAESLASSWSSDASAAPSPAACAAAIDALPAPSKAASSLSSDCFTSDSTSPVCVWSRLVSSCFGRGSTVHAVLPGTDGLFCRSMCAFERQTGVATGAAGGSFACGRVGHSDDARFEVCTEVEQQKETILDILQREHTGDESKMQLLLTSLRERNRRSTAIYHVMAEQIQQRSEVRT
jgi:hypothetical protein